MLDENYTFTDRLKFVCNAKVRYKPQNKSYIPVVIFLLIAIIASMMSFWLIEFKDLWAEILQGSVYLVALVLYLSLVLKGKKVDVKP